MIEKTPAFSLSAALLGAALTWSAALGATPDDGAAQPQDGVVADGVYRNPYFALAYPLPKGWKGGFEGPPPSSSGSYVLATPMLDGEPKATMLIAAQDLFFAAAPMADATAMAGALRRSAAETSGLAAESAPVQVTIAGRGFTRVDIGGVALSRIFMATDIRCHIVSFTFASADPELLQSLAASLAAASLPSQDSPAVPICIKDYATPDTVLHRVEPVTVGPTYLKIPVRIVVGRDGRVKHIHVIRAFPAQAKSIEDALAAWQFKPYLVNGAPVEIETGLLFEFKPSDKPR